MRISIIGAIVLAFVQSSGVIGTNLGVLETKIQVDAGRSALYRGADMAYGASFASFMEFLNEQIPLNATVVVIPNSSRAEYSDTFFLQYFFFPRAVLVCRNRPVGDCIGSTDDHPMAIVRSQPALDTGEWAAGAQYIPFNEEMGVWLLQN